MTTPVLPPFHQRLVESALGLCDTCGLLLAGAYSMSVHGLVDRPSRGLDLVTTGPLPAGQVAARVADAYRARGFTVETATGDERSARLVVTDPASGESCGIDLMTAALSVTPTTLGAFPVVGFDDAVGLSMRAVHDRGIAPDLIDAASLAGTYGFERLEWLCRSHEPDFSLDRLAARLESAELRDDMEFADYGLDHEEVLRVKRFAAEWAQDINLRLLEETPYEDDTDDS
ncbi:hypothetical protein [Actinomadura sp. HBU206391]|uniref:hypothetical protein n=1 Tax=Actinomadura sp. HBU206391 TaxID=2731692 RepID=UPI00164F43B5|nr:hypothetical protein [Actinomadura sp. HBU206391]MBC6458006.1 hypothetical protein [Actinomadura sp. HBU206391]